jgi:uncharacterized protein (DUF934 family)
MAFIRDRMHVPDLWQLLKPDAEGVMPPLPAAGDVIVPISVWREARAQLLERPGRLGVWVADDQDPAEVAGDLEHFEVVAVNFPKFTNGRGYSIGRLLRERHGWRGELRAIGDVQRDQIFYLTRCGFDALQLREGEDPNVALEAFNDFSEGYQASVDRPVPLFRRREAAKPHS